MGVVSVRVVGTGGGGLTGHGGGDLVEFVVLGEFGLGDGR